MPLPTIVANTVLVGAMLAWVYTPDALVQGFLVNGASVAFGEAVVLYVLGVPLAIALQRTNLLARAKLTPQA
jgi:ABC-type Fe3+ transport system permease subunit